jgi:hypothetical protein
LRTVFNLLLGTFASLCFVILLYVVTGIQPKSKEEEAEKLALQKMLVILSTIQLSFAIAALFRNKRNWTYHLT